MLFMIKKKDFLKELCQYHISGQLKVAPEHVFGRCSKEDGENRRMQYMNDLRKNTGK